MDRKDHPAWSHLSGPAATRAQLEIHYTQEYEVYVRDFPVLLSRLHARCPVAEVRRDLAENLYEEETGRLSRTGPHPELFLDMMAGLGLPRERFGRVELLPAARAYREWLDEATRRQHWLTGVAVVTLFVEGSVKDRAELEGRPAAPLPLSEEPLVRFHGVQPASMRLKAAHGQVEAGHRRAAWTIVASHAIGTARRRAVRTALERSLRLWLAYRDAVAAACGLPERAGHLAAR
jgi:pyrroloquinoline quinone (PQQ) biosynthesis protein C